MSLGTRDRCRDKRTVLEIGRKGHSQRSSVVVRESHGSRWYVYELKNRFETVNKANLRKRAVTNRETKLGS